MGFRVSMLAIAAWRLFLLYPAVLSQDPPSSNPLLPGGFTNSVNMTLTFKLARTEVQLCYQTFTIEAVEQVIDFSDPNLVVNASVFRSPPQVSFSGIDATAYYTWVIVNQEEAYGIYGSREKPLIEEMRVNIQGSNRGVSVVPFSPTFPDFLGRGGVTILLYRQATQISNPSLAGYVKTECKLGLRCVFDVEKYKVDNDLTLEFAGYVGVKEDKFSLYRLSQLNEILACRHLWQLTLKENSIIGDADLRMEIKARFQSKEVMTEPLCARVFHYMPEDVYVTWNNNKGFKVRQVQEIPQVHLRFLTDKTVEGRDATEHEDMLFTLMLVDQTVFRNNTSELPFVNWVVSNIKNTQINTGDCSVPYLAPLIPRGMGTATFLLYKQSDRIEIEPSDFSKTLTCVFQYRCNWDLAKLAKDKELELVGALPFNLEADPVSVNNFVQRGLFTGEVACNVLGDFTGEGRMLGKCLPKFDAWKALKKELEECVVEFKKKIIRERMANMCPELGSHFSGETKKWFEKSREDEGKEAGVEYRGDKGDHKDVDMDIKTQEMGMFMKTFFITEKLEMIQEYFKHKMALENRCPLSDDSRGDKDSQSKCMRMFKEQMMKKKFIEMLKEEASDMKNDKPDVDKAFFNKLVASMMGADTYEGRKYDM